jgi:hypothetical protein
MEFITMKHSGNTGDIVAALAGIHEISNKLCKKVILYIRLNTPAHYYAGCPTHPVQKDGAEVMINRQMFDMLKPLLIAQPYIQDVKVWKGEKVIVDLDDIREVFVNMPFGAIQRWYFYSKPDMACDLSKAWLYSPRAENDKIVVNRTSRYREASISYYCLAEHEKDVVFAGTKAEHENFCEEWDLDVDYLEVNNFLELAAYIKGCRLFIGNQSMCWNLAEALKVPRIVEVCRQAPNCIPHGADAFDFLNQKGLETSLEFLNNKYKKN